ncbi:MAG: hypothetical protein KF767_14430, partial [Bdellovibrionaceae bacterium]|nr:hypothetical protein [Pseudobdellovibrionaceae bacterium]
LHEGEFLEVLDVVNPAPANLIFFDPYSPKKNSDMWTPEAFAKLRAKCDNERGALLMTYSRATPIRVALLQAGFFVGAGAGTGLKDETTQAATTPTLLSKVLGKEFLDRWSRSQTPFPYGHAGQDLGALRAELEAHPQFNS